MLINTGGRNQTVKQFEKLKTGKVEEWEIVGR